MNKGIKKYNISAVEVYKLVLNGGLKRFPRGIWEEDNRLQNALDVTKYLIEEYLKWTDDDIKERFNINILRSNKLAGMINAIFDGSPFKTLDNAYPNKFKIWELRASSVNDGYWNKETSVEAIKWMIEKEMKWSDEEIKRYYDVQTFKDNNLYGMLHHYFNYKPFDAINIAYPNKFKQWELKGSPKNYWNKETAKQACDWLFNEKLLWNINDIKNNISLNTFLDNNLNGLLAKYKNSPYLLLKDVYSNENWSVLKSRYK